MKNVFCLINLYKILFPRFQILSGCFTDKSAGVIWGYQQLIGETRNFFYFGTEKKSTSNQQRRSEEGGGWSLDPILPLRPPLWKVGKVKNHIKNAQLENSGLRMHLKGSTFHCVSHNNNRNLAQPFWNPLTVPGGGGARGGITQKARKIYCYPPLIIFNPPPPRSTGGSKNCKGGGEGNIFTLI